ncbi:MAG: DUF1501 domain-containing protein [Sphingomonadales bacterium]
MPTRRQLLGAMMAAPLATLSFPAIGWANAPGRARFVVLILRGGMDGLSAVPAHADPALASRRGPLDLGSPRDGVLDLDGTFGLHPGLPTLHALYGSGELAVIHAVSSPYRDRSHFSGQDVLENGTLTDRGAGDGWLGRALAHAAPAPETAIAVRETVPLLLRGGKGVMSWSPSALPDVDADTLERVAMLYEGDPLFAEALDAAIGINRMAGSEIDGADRQAGRLRRVGVLMEAAGRFLAADDGPSVAAVDIGGWDTHARQSGLLGSQFAMLDQGVASLREALDAAWRHTAVLTITEFGRTVAANGSGGTDHGTGGVSFLLGGAVKGGRVIADWPGLSPSALLDGRDLRPTTDLRAVAKGILADHLHVAGGALDTVVFPGSENVRPMQGLIRG